MKRGHMNFLELLTAVNFREGFRMARCASWNGTDWYEFKDGFFCRGEYTGEGNESKLTKCAFPEKADREKRDWIIRQNEDGKVPKL